MYDGRNGQGVVLNPSRKPRLFQAPISTQSARTVVEFMGGARSYIQTWAEAPAIAMLSVLVAVMTVLLTELRALLKISSLLPCTSSSCRACCCEVSVALVATVGLRDAPKIARGWRCRSPAREQFMQRPRLAANNSPLTDCRHVRDPLRAGGWWRRLGAPRRRQSGWAAVER